MSLTFKLVTTRSLSIIYSKSSEYIGMAHWIVPKGQAARVSIIDAGSSISSIPTGRLMAPVLDGFSHMPKMPSLSFLIESDNGKTALFDLGIAKGWRDFAPIVSNRLKTNGYEIDVNCEVPDVLQKHNVDLASIHSVVWRFVETSIGGVLFRNTDGEIVIGIGITSVTFLNSLRPLNLLSAQVLARLFCQLTLRAKSLQFEFPMSGKYF